MNHIDKPESCPASTQEAARETDKLDKERFDFYLGIFAMLSSLIAAFGLIELLLAATGINPTSPVYYPIVVIPTCLLAAGMSLYFRSQTHVRSSEDNRPQELTARQKFIGLVIAAMTYLVGLTALTAWTGGVKASPYAAFVLLTASFGAYLARKWWTRAFVGVLVVFSYALVSCWFFDRTTAQVVFGWPDWRYAHELAIVVIVVF